MAIIKQAKNIIVKNNKEIVIAKKYIEVTEEKYLEATKGDIVLNSLKKIIAYGNA